MEFPRAIRRSLAHQGSFAKRCKVFFGLSTPCPRNLLTVMARYFNTVTEEQQSLPPPNFKGGILADQMGLGKTLSIIALIAQDKDEAKSPMRFNTDKTVKTTLIVVRAPCESVICWRLRYGKCLLRDQVIHTWDEQLEE